MENFHILVVCTGNICRSPMAEGLLRHLLPQKYQSIVTVSSAGTDALHGNRATDLAVQAVQDYGVDISAHRARRLNRSMITEADLILAMEQYHLMVIRSMLMFGAGKSHLLSDFDSSQASYDVPDPIGGDLDLYIESAKLIHDCLGGVYMHIEGKE